MNASSALLLAVLATAGGENRKSDAKALETHLSTLPLTYVLDYGPDHLRNPDYIQKIAATPPTLLHLGKDVPFTHNWGPIQATGGENQAYGKRRPYAKEDYTRRLSPAEVRQRIADLRQMVDQLHAAGVRYVLPYICSMTLAGHAEKRTGFWEFYDHWDEYAEFGLGKRPASDPKNWFQLDADGKPLIFYQYKGDFYPPYEPNHRYAACQNNPDWRYWLEKVVENLARCGFDGTFVDNGGSLRCYCGHCQKKWQAWIERRYPEPLRTQLFGASPVAMGTEREPGLRWAETCRFRNASLAEHLAAIKAAGHRASPREFLVFPNGGEHRPEQVVGAFANADLIMFERSYGPYGTNPGVVRWPIVEDLVVSRFNDNIFENKLVQCLRQTVRPMMLTRPGYGVPRKVRLLLEMNPPSTTLGCAETAAFGGGGGFLVRLNPACLEAQKEYRGFQESHAALFSGLDSWAEVGLALFPDEKYFGNRAHEPLVRRITHRLLDARVLFDYVLPEQFRGDWLRRYRVIILPQIEQLPSDAIAALQAYLDQGGTVVLLGDIAGKDEFGRPRTGALSDLKSGAGGTRIDLPADDAAMEKLGWFKTDRAETLSTLSLPSGGDATRLYVQAMRSPDHRLAVVHLLNYRTPLGENAPPPAAIGPLELSLPSATKPQTALAHDPSGKSTAVDCRSEGGRLKIRLPQLRVHTMIEIRW